MIYAKEAHKTAQDNNTYEETVKAAVDKILPLFDEGIRKISEEGFFSMLVKRGAIQQKIGWTICPTNEIMDAIAEELREYGYDVTIPKSYTSIHVNW